MMNNINKHFDEKAEKLGKRLDEFNENFQKHCDDIINDMKERNEKWKWDTGKCNESKNNQLIENKVGDSDSDNYNSDITSNNGDIIKDIVVESKVMNNDSDEILMRIEVNGLSLIHI